MRRFILFPINFFLSPLKLAQTRRRNSKILMSGIVLKNIPKEINTNY